MLATTIQVSARAALVTLETVRIALGCDAESVLNCVGDATHPKFLRWVFNVAVKPAGKIRELRFWKEEIFGTRRTFPRGEIEVQWTMNHMTISRLVRNRELTEVNHELTRASLAAFLERRLQ